MLLRTRIRDVALIITVGTPTKARKLFNDKAKMKKAILKAGHSEEHADAFIADCEKENGIVQTALTTIGTAITDKLVGKDLLMQVNGNKILKKLITTTLLAPQYLVKAASFEMSIHFKSGNLQLWLEYKDGGKQILVDTPDPG